MEARRRWIVFGIVFAAFFRTKDGASCQSAARPSGTAEITDSGYGLCKRANA